MSSPNRRRRGAATQTLVANYLAQHGWPLATDAGAGRAGSDILATPGIVWEVKARREIGNLAAHLRQALRDPTRPHALPVAVIRPDGMGPASLPDWPAVLRLADLVDLLRAAGYGDPPSQEETMR